MKTTNRRKATVFLIATLLGVVSLLVVWLGTTIRGPTTREYKLETLADVLLNPDIIGNPYPLRLMPLEVAQSKVHFTILTPKDLSRLAAGTSLLGVEVIVDPYQERTTLVYSSEPNKAYVTAYDIIPGGMIVEEMTLKLDDPTGWFTRYASQFAPDPARHITTLKGHPALLAPSTVMWWNNNMMYIITANLGEADLILIAESMM